MLRHRVPLILAALACVGFLHKPRTMTLYGASEAQLGWNNAISIDFDGTDDYVTLGTPLTGMNGYSPDTDELTISVWFKQDTLAAQHYIFSQARPFAPLITTIMAANTDGTVFGYFDGTSTSGGAAGTAVWRHMAYTSGPDSCGPGQLCGRIWLDGAQVGSNVASGTADAGAYDWLIGAARNADNTDYTLNFDGNEDELTIWSVAFDATEIAELRNGGKPDNPANHSRAATLIHYYPMGDGDVYPTLLDLVSGDDGTMTNMAADDFETDVAEIFTPLSCSGCDLNFVAGDWSGTGNWSATDGGWTATLNGTPTRAISSTFHSTYAIGGWSSSNYFAIAAATAHNPTTTGDGSAWTYEFVLDNLPVTALVSWFGNIYNGNDGGWWFFTQSSNRFEIGLANLAASYYLGGLTTTSAYTTDKPVLITVTMDFAAPASHLYINGAEHTGGVWPDSTADGTFNSESCDLAIGGRWSCNSSTLGSPSADIRIIQILRHRSVLDSTTITARAAQFGRLKGY